MSNRVLWAIPAALFALVACFFIAGNLDPLSWDPGGRAIVVFIVVFAFGATATSPFIEGKRNA